MKYLAFQRKQYIMQHYMFKNFFNSTLFTLFTIPFFPNKKVLFKPEIVFPPAWSFPYNFYFIYFVFYIIYIYMTFPSLVVS